LVKGLSWRPPHPNLTVGLEAIYHHLPLGLVLEELPEKSLLLGVILTYLFKASLYEPYGTLK